MESTNEQKKYDELMQELEQDFQRFSQNFRKTITAFRTLFQFEHNGDAMIQISNQSRLMTFGNADMDYKIIDADYVENSQAFNHQVEAFEQFYQKEKEASLRHLTSLGMTLEPEVAPLALPQRDVTVEAEPYSLAWLKNSENATWELESKLEYDWHSQSSLTHNLYRTHEGEFILHVYRAVDGHETIERNLSDDAVKAFVRDRFHNSEGILKEMGIEIEEALPVMTEPTSHSKEEQLKDKIENEYLDFKESMKQLSKDDLMRAENAYEILVKSEIRNHVVAAKTPDELAAFLEHDHLLDAIYDEYTAKDSNTFSLPIETAINDVVSHMLTNEGSIEHSFSDDGFTTEGIDTDPYVEVQATDELDSGDVGNMKKHKERTNIRDFGYQSLE